MLNLLKSPMPAEPETFGYVPRLPHSPTPVIPLLPVQPRRAPFPADSLPRLRLLRKAVAERPEDRFDMKDWGSESPCGTVCCAAGSYVEANPGCGLTLVNDGGFDLSILVVGGEDPGDAYDIARDLADHFGISYPQSLQLFMPDDEPGKAAVLARIDDIIAAKEAEQTSLPDDEPDIDAPDPFESDFGETSIAFAASTSPESAQSQLVEDMLAHVSALCAENRGLRFDLAEAQGLLAKARREAEDLRTVLSSEKQAAAVAAERGRAEISGLKRQLGETARELSRRALTAV